MIKKILLMLGVVLVVLGVWYVVTGDRDEIANDLQQTTIGSKDQVPTAQTCVADECLEVEGLQYPVGQLSESVISALNEALNDEYKARATYDAVIAKLGPVRPFSMIIRAEEQHISSIKALFDKYGVNVPTDPFLGMSAAETRQENCAAAVLAESQNIALYRDTLLAQVADYRDITTVFTSLMSASRDNHLPAFEQCASQS